MAPQFYDVDAYYGTRYIPDEGFRVVIDWHPRNAATAKAELDGHLRAIHRNNCAVFPDLRLYALHGWAIDDAGLRGYTRTWLWRVTTDEEGQPWRP